MKNGFQIRTRKRCLDLITWNLQTRVFVHGQCDGNVLSALGEYHNRYPDRRQAHKSVFETMRCNLKETGTIGRCECYVRDEGVDDNPSASTRHISSAIGRSRNEARRTKRKIQFYYFPCTTGALIAARKQTAPSPDLAMWTPLSFWAGEEVFTQSAHRECLGNEESPCNWSPHPSEAFVLTFAPKSYRT